MSLEIAHSSLAWPPPDHVMDPPGAGARIIANIAQKKIGQTLSRVTQRDDVRIGVLLEDATSDSTQAPIAVVCEFKRRADPRDLAEAQRLCWNFSAAPALFTVEPGLIRSWTCCEPPVDPNQRRTSSPELLDATFRAEDFASATERTASSALHWLNLLHGRLFRQQPKRFNRENCADRLFLNNLRQLRHVLIDEQSLDIDTSHDLLARLIFIQFLFDRKDSQGRAALNSDLLRRLHEEQIIITPATNLSEILTSKPDTYRFFSWLNQKFNGDLFPSDAVETGAESELAREMRIVEPQHLDTLSSFVAGQLEFQTGQHSLWPQYSFDTIRLEFISSIYETFLSKSRKRSEKAIYTPSHVVEFVLDSVLPWNSTEWDLRILDPACGSGIFLVKAFQRLIHRWRLAHPGEDPKAEVLRRMLERNVVGIDLEEHAVRTAVFSLYLALCDEIDPKYYWQQIRFPKLRHNTLLARDFFSMSSGSHSREVTLDGFDLVVGNAPWGKNSLTEAALTWCTAHKWSTNYNDIGPLFLAKGSEHMTTNGKVSFLQPSTLLFGTGSNADDFRRRLFSEFDVLEVVNLSALRFGLFAEATGPACVITYSTRSECSDLIQYISPRATKTASDNYRIRIEPGDVHTVYREEAINEPLVWSVLRWGHRRDLALIRKLSRFTSLAQHESAKRVSTSSGIIRGDRKKALNNIVGRPILESEGFPPDVFLELCGTDLPINQDPSVHSKGSTDFGPFELPQLIIKKGFQQAAHRFRAALVTEKSILCSDSYVTVHGPSSILRTAAAVYNSSIAIYFLFLTSSRLGTYRPAVLQRELLNMPLPERLITIDRRTKTFNNLDVAVRQAWDLKESEWAIIEDRVQYTIQDFFEGAESAGRLPTSRVDAPNEESTPNEVAVFCEYLIRVLKAVFGSRVELSATIFAELEGHAPLAVRMVAIHLNHAEPGIRTVRSSSQQLSQELRGFEQRSKQDEAAGILFSPKIVRWYDFVNHNGTKVPTVFLIRPDEVRFWTRTEALQEGDEVSEDLLRLTNTLGIEAPRGPVK